MAATMPTDTEIERMEKAVQAASEQIERVRRLLQIRTDITVVWENPLPSI